MIAEELAKLVLKSGEKRCDIAKRAGISPSQVTRLLTGERKGVTIETAEKLAAGLGLELTLVPKKPRKSRTKPPVE